MSDTLDRAAHELETKFANQPQRRTMLQVALGKTNNALGLYAEAIEQQEKTPNDYQAALGVQPSDTIEAINHLASAYSLAWRLGKALPLQEKNLELSRGQRKGS